MRKCITLEGEGSAARRSEDRVAQLVRGISEVCGTAEWFVWFYQGFDPDGPDPFSPDVVEARRQAVWPVWVSGDELASALTNTFQIDDETLFAVIDRDSASRIKNGAELFHVARVAFFNAWWWFVYTSDEAVIDFILNNVPVKEITDFP